MEKRASFLWKIHPISWAMTFFPVTMLPPPNGSSSDGLTARQGNHHAEGVVYHVLLHRWRERYAEAVEPHREFVHLFAENVQYGFVHVDARSGCAASASNGGFDDFGCRRIGERIHCY